MSNVYPCLFCGLRVKASSVCVDNAVVGFVVGMQV